MRKLIYLILIVISISSYFIITRKISITSDGMSNCQLILFNKENIEGQELRSNNKNASLRFSFKENKDSFIGFSINLKDSILNFSKTPNIDFNISNTNTEFLIACIYSNLEENPYGISEVVLEKDIFLNSGDGNYKIHLSDFVIKDWWYITNNISLRDKSIIPNFKEVKAFGFGISKTPNIPADKEILIQVNEVSVSRPHSLWWGIGGFSLVVLIYLALIDFLKKQNFILKGVESSKLPDISDSDKISKKMIQFIGRYYGNSKLSVSHAADVANISNDQVDLILRDHYKLSFKQYLTNVRLTEAKRLLIESDYSIKEISSVVGFSNVSVFNRTFKKNIGKTPSELR